MNRFLAWRNRFLGSLNFDKNGVWCTLNEKKSEGGRKMYITWANGVASLFNCCAAPSLPFPTPCFSNKIVFDYGLRLFPHLASTPLLLPPPPSHLITLTCSSHPSCPPDPHCKDKMPKIWNKYSQKRNIGASVPISTFMCLWADNICSRWVCLFCWREYPYILLSKMART